MRFLVRASCFLVQPFASAHFCSEKPRLTLASERGRGNSLSLTEPSGFVVENYSTPWAFGSSAASLAHRRRPRCPRSPGGSGTTGSRSSRSAPWRGGQRCASWPRGRIFGSSEVILQMAACASVKMVTAPIAWLLVAATWRALAMRHTQRRRLPGPNPCGSCDLSRSDSSSMSPRSQSLRSPGGIRP